LGHRETVFVLVVRVEHLFSLEVRPPTPMVGGDKVQQQFPNLGGLSFYLRTKLHFRVRQVEQ
jgi:hypothetical protein